MEEEKTLNFDLVEEALKYLNYTRLTVDENTFSVDVEGVPHLDPEFAERLKHFITIQKRMDSELSEFKSKLIEFWNDNEIAGKFGIDGVSLNVIRGYDTTRIDSTLFKEMLPEVAEYFSKKSTVGQSARISVDEPENINY